MSTRVRTAWAAGVTVLASIVDDQQDRPMLGTHAAAHASGPALNLSSAGAADSRVGSGSG